MTNEERAKQFMPFDALKGLREELKKREEKYLREKKKELTEEEILALSKKIIQIKKGDTIQITFFYAGHYVVLKEEVEQVNTVYKYIKIKDNKIAFEDVLDIEIIYDA